MSRKVTVIERKYKELEVVETALITGFDGRELMDSDEPEKLLLTWLEIKPFYLEIKSINFSGDLAKVKYKYPR